MRKKKKDRLTLAQTVKNDWYALKLGFSIQKNLVIHAFFLQAAGYFEWVFFDAIFMRRIVDALDQNKGFEEIFLFIFFSGVLFFCLNLYTNYAENVVQPLGLTRLYGGIYSRLYKKAKNVELRCYEDAEFYNRYTMAMDGAEQKVYQIVNNVWGVLGGTVSVATVFWFMYEIDHYAVLFILSPLLGNFVFGNYKNKWC